MHQSKLLNLIAGFEIKEIHWFQKFLDSPFYNSNDEFILLFKYLKKYYPEFDSPKLSKPTVFKKLYPDEEFNVQKLRKTMHGLALLAEEFLVAIQLRGNPFEKKKLLITALGERNIYNYFKKKTENLLSEIEQNKQRDEHFYEDHYQLTYQLVGHTQTIRQSDTDTILQRMSNDLDYGYFIRKLALACNYQLLKKIYNSSEQLSFIEAIIAEVDYRKLYINPTINLYFLIFKIVSDDQKIDLLDGVIQLFKKEKTNLSPKHVEIILKLLINISARQINVGNSVYIEQNFQLYKIGLAIGALISNGKMSANTFGNIISGGAFLKEFDWTKKFIDEYQVYLDDEIKDEVVAFNLSNLYFNQKKYEEAIDLLLSRDFQVVLYKIMTKTLLLKCYYSLFQKDSTYFELMIAQLDAFEKYIRREKSISENNQISFINLAKYLRRIVNRRIQHKNLAYLSAKIKKEKLLSNRSWLLEQLKK